ncbi:hypothetical protein OG875_16750 [Streptomyces sp. NBC_01498]|uniref:hypothetical protein n=1 Tax=Streptomyces sp. NBC_01498 TaxID=2975870 RepID=UPI002E7AFE02|nr:hypothetical protein [Streptomyces sp. NBC_01498]WTL26094.1 hypothetical protein OG875_16750 [Streptomyces sp. NBC_01498]
MPCADRPLAAFWLERTVYESLDADSRSRVSRRSVADPAEAIRAIRVDVRALADELGPAERERALRWTGFGGSLGAVAALHRGEACGFSLSGEGRWWEWTVQPYPAFDGKRASLLPWASHGGPAR